MSYDRILIPTDGSRGSRRGVEAALELARDHDADVHVLFVVDERIHGSTPALSDVELVFEQVEDRGRAVVDEIAEQCGERGLDVVGSVCRGITHEEIKRYADEHDVDLIVMGLHGLSAHSRLHEGGTIDRVQRSTAVPVVSV